MMRRLAVTIAVSGLAASLLSAQVPAGPEVRVDGGGSSDPSVAAYGSGEFIVVWQHVLQLNSVRGQRLSLSGSPVAAPFGLGFPQTNYADAHVAVDPKGNGIAVWRDARSQTLRVKVRRFDSEGAPQGAGQVVGGQFNSFKPAVASQRNGGSVVVWTSSGYPLIPIRAAIFDAWGTPVGDSFLVSPSGTGTQNDADVATDASGNFVIVWGANVPGFEVYGRRFDATGMPLGTQFRINTTTFGNQHGPAVAMQDDGRFVVVWHDSMVDDVRGQIFASSGDRIGSEFLVSRFVFAGASIAADASGNFVVVWRPFFTSDFHAQRFDSNGSRRGAEFRVNTYPTGGSVPAVTSDRVGNFLVAWTFLSSTSEPEVHVQAFGGLVPASLEVDGAGNEVLEPGESVEIGPSWRSANEAPQTFSGVLSDASPPGAAIEITDATSSYGTVATGDVAGCVECYRAIVSAALPRPSAHWDAFLREEIAPEAHGQRQRWIVHIGESFTDVPRTNTFYRQIETLLHHGVETGCSGTTFCPDGRVTRAQMGNVVLAAGKATALQPSASSASMAFRDDAGLSLSPGPVEGITRQEAAILALRTADPSLDPPACTTPLFNDVPATSRYCRWIEELARREGAVGCGDGSFCPAAVLARGEMAAFVTAAFGLQLYGP